MQKETSVVAEMDGRDLALWRATYKDVDFGRKKGGCSCNNESEEKRNDLEENRMMWKIKEIDLEKKGTSTLAAERDERLRDGSADGTLAFAAG